MFIVFEGVDFVGKTTASKMMRDKLAAKFPKKMVVWLRAPEGPIRELLLSRENHVFDNETEMLLFAASHRWIIETNVKPILANGNIVVLDRFIDSTISYQGGGRNLGIEFVQKFMQKHVHSDYRPDHTLFITSPEDIREQRRLDRLNEAGKLDFMDEQGQAFRQRNAEVMRQLYHQYTNAYYANPRTAMGVSEIENDGTVEKFEAYLDDWLEQHLADLQQRAQRWVKKE